MSFIPEVITTEELMTQTLALQVRKDELTLTRDEIAERLNTIEHVLKENELLAAKAQEQVKESVDLFTEEWAKIKVCYPEIRLNILQRTLENITAKDAKK